MTDRILAQLHRLAIWCERWLDSRRYEHWLEIQVREDAYQEFAREYERPPFADWSDEDIPF